MELELEGTHNGDGAILVLAHVYRGGTWYTYDAGKIHTRAETHRGMWRAFDAYAQRVAAWWNGPLSYRLRADHDQQERKPTMGINDESVGVLASYLSRSNSCADVVRRVGNVQSVRGSLEGHSERTLLWEWLRVPSLDAWRERHPKRLPPIARVD